MIYFDYNSTYPFDTKKLEEFCQNKLFVNASSIHFLGRKSRYDIENARREIINNILSIHEYNQNDPWELIFTSSGTEANNMILNSFEHVLASEIEHVSIRNYLLHNFQRYPDIENANVLNLDSLRKTFDFIPLQSSGYIDCNELESLLLDLNLRRKQNQDLNEFSKPILVSIMHSNNETGVIQNLEFAYELCKKYGALLHSDICQSLGRVKVCLDFIDIATISAHKVGGLIGVGGVLYRKSLRLLLSSFLYGGSQEIGKRASTENILAILSFAHATQNLKKTISIYQNNVLELRNILEHKISKSGGIIINQDANRLPNTSMIVMKGVLSELQLIQFDLVNICLSNGSACSSGRVAESYVLNAMSYKEYSDQAIRVSIGPDNTLNEVNIFVNQWVKIVAQAK